jgi:hypothetical protein
MENGSICAVGYRGEALTSLVRCFDSSHVFVRTRDLTCTYEYVLRKYTEMQTCESVSVLTSDPNNTKSIQYSESET